MFVHPFIFKFNLSVIAVLCKLPMARRKQAAPLQREPSDFDKGPPDSPSHGWKHANGNISKSPAVVSNGKPNEPFPSTSQEQAGLTQLVICVAGIYASL